MGVLGQAHNLAGSHSRCSFVATSHYAISVKEYVR